MEGLMDLVHFEISISDTIAIAVSAWIAKTQVQHDGVA